MAYNPALLARARGALAERRQANEAERERRAARVKARIPRVGEIDAALRRQMAELCALTFSREPDAPGKLAALRGANLALQAERAELLRAAGLPADYTDEIYTCAACHDSGYVDGEPCECLIREYKALLTRELSGLMRDGGESFENFRLDFYSAEPDPALGGASPRETMRLVFETCRTWARGLSRSSPSLIFRGGPGLGKTFLSACIAREAAARGFSVAYESAPAALGEFEKERFSRDAAEAAAAAAKVREYMGCDLMILDDLGTEMTTSFTVSALYQLVNGRLAASRQTIISTNLDDAQIERRYGPQTASRLAGEYELLVFAGSDIRRIKKERGL
ncbi:MAG TPA: ATP-binding protein [Candidatus Scatomorpha stercoravium]|nr:ATP-binding protein [Candidatus Scatomorpha stercoravium]